MGLVELIAGVFKPAADLIDDMHTSEDERLARKAKLLDIQAAVIDKGLEYELGVFEAKSRIVNSEAQSEHWLTATWRPIVMLVFTALVVLDSLGWLPNRLSGEAWLLLQIGLGGYVVSRGGEKITEKVLRARKGEASP